VACLLPHRNGRRWEVRVGEMATVTFGETFILPATSRAAGMTSANANSNTGVMAPDRSELIDKH
jgi:hypothetical protein